MVNLSPYLVAAVALPTLGYLIDQIGERYIFFILSTLLVLSGHLSLLLHPSCEDQCNSIIVVFVVYGLYLTLYILIGWGSVGLFVRTDYLSTAYGFLSCFQNMGTTFLPILLNVLLDETNSYKSVELAFVCIALTSLALKLVIGWWDLKYRGGILMAKDPFQSFEKYLSK